MTDLRQGVSEATHAVLDRLEDAHGPMPRADGFPILFLADARKAVNAAMRADPQTGMGRRRRDQAIEAAVLLIRALECMDEKGAVKLGETAPPPHPSLS